MNLSKQSFSILSLAICLLSVQACSSRSSESSYSGETVTTTEISKDVTLTETENRRLLPSGKIAGEDAALMQLSAKVEKVDKASRKVTLKDSEGHSSEVLVGPEVTNFNQIDPGDTVAVDYYVSVAFEVREPTQEEVQLANSAIELTAKAAKGEKPSAGIAKGSIHIATVDSIDKENQIVTLRGLSTPDSLTPVKAKYAENLSRVKVGDKIVVTITESFAAAVTEL